MLVFKQDFTRYNEKGVLSIGSREDFYWMNSSADIKASCLTDRGLIRQQNEDICWVNPRDKYFLVADGIGGAKAGDIASQIFLDTVNAVFTTTKPGNHKELEKLVEACFDQANQAIQDHIDTTPAHAGMGCTAELFAINGHSYVLGHIGDSRTYRLEGDELILLTKDHSLAQEQLDMGVMTAAQAEKSSLRNVLSRAIGIKQDIVADISTGVLTPGSIFLLCTDGLYNMVEPKEIVTVLQYDAPLAMKAEMLVKMANDSGGRDNISVSLVEIPPHI